MSKKQPKQRESPASVKSPKSNVTVGSVGKPTWRFSIFDIDGPFGTGKHQLSQINLAEVIWPKLRDFESMSWKEIVTMTKSHNVETSKLDVAARRKLESLKIDDIEELFSLRLTGKQRIWGILENSTLKILWWDPEHLVCPSILKHT